LQLTKLNNTIEEFKKRNIKLLIIVTDRSMSLKKLSEKENYDFTVIADEKAEIAKQFKAFGKPIDYDMIKFELAIPTTYLIDTDGKIIWRYLGNKTDRPSIEAILEAIDTKL
jgi:peroxiredoxin